MVIIWKSKEVKGMLKKISAKIVLFLLMFGITAIPFYSGFMESTDASEKVDLL